MLRRPLSKPSVFRQFSSSSAIWNARPPQAVTQEKRAQDVQHLDNASTPTPPEDFRTESPSPTHPDVNSSTRSGPSDTHEALPPYDLELVKQRIRTWSENAAIALRNKVDDFTASTQTTFSQLGSELNRVTGYDEIEVLKRGIVEQEERINMTREAAKKAKQALDEAVARRSNSQREVNDLLSRKSSWHDSDVGRFTTLVRQDHLYEQEEARAKIIVEETESAVEKEFSQLLRAILARYHEEQVWSDKIRSASTYGSLAALGLNMLVFIIAIIIVEPWKRRRLAQTFERKLEELSGENEVRLGASMQSISQQIDEQAKMLETLKEEVSTKMELAVKSQPLPVTQIQEPAPCVDILSWHISHRQLEMAAVGAGAFAIGILSNLLLGR
ncbi:hypothetical protein BDN70DRAFT_927217 [Pholiota conissans]|uniref:Sensitive to high expression protein 9, mitochondrial n=1 Tax=Pholiota conissans TaxID=109636 RepID=A0A9P6D7J6_9AGAR|nr:hypothetical protein BDN70DRAFT_927217 [Pholiota conissans]